MFRMVMAVVIGVALAGCTTNAGPSYTGPGHRDCSLPGSYCSSQRW